MKLKTATVLLLLVVFVAGCKQRKITETQLLSISQPFTKLIIISKTGDITIKREAGTSPGVAVSAEKFAVGLTKHEARQYLDQIKVYYEFDDGTCTITVALPKYSLPTVRGGADMIITGLQDIPLDINLDTGSVTCDSMAGGFVTSTNGTITIQEATGDLELATGTGDIIVDNYYGNSCNLLTHTGSASITITDNGSLNGSVKTETGDIYCGFILKPDTNESPSASVELATGTGAITINGTDNYTKSGTDSQQASFHLGAAEGTFTLETGTGAITVSVLEYVTALSTLFENE